MWVSILVQGRSTRGLGGQHLSAQVADEQRFEITEPAVEELVV